jgi:hypothetical protein
MLLYAGTRAVTVAFVCMALFWAFPTVIEILLVPAVGSFFAVIILGDLLGCAVLAAWDRITGIGLYVALTILELVVWRAGVVRPAALAWFTDLVPAVVVSVLAVRRSISAHFRGTNPDWFGIYSRST